MNDIKNDIINTLLRENRDCTVGGLRIIDDFYYGYKANNPNYTESKIIELMRNNFSNIVLEVEKNSTLIYALKTLIE